MKQNQEDLPLLAHPQELYLFVKEYGLILNQELNSIKRSQWQKDWTLFFDMDNYLKKKMGRSNSGDWKMIFGTNLSTLNIGLTIWGRAKWQGTEATRKDFNIVLSSQDKKFFTFCERGALLNKESDSSWSEVHRGSCSGNIHMEEGKVEVKVQENEVKDGKDKWRVRREGRREIKHTDALDDAHKHLSQCRVRHHYECGQTREKGDVWGALFAPPSVATDCHLL